MAIVAPHIVGTPVTARASSATPSISFFTPPGLLNNDLLVVFLRTNGSTSPSDFTAPGWERRGRAFTPNDPGTRVNGFFIHRVLDATQEASVHTFTKSVADSRIVGAMLVLRDVDVNDPINGFSPGHTSAAPLVYTNTLTNADSTPSLLIEAFAGEFTANLSTEPVSIPAGSVKVVDVANSDSIAASRTNIWVGQATIATTTVEHQELTWAGAGASSTYAAGIAFRGTEGAITAPDEGVTIKFRRGTTAEWTAKNPVLGAGEPGFNLSTKTLRIGDGVTAYLSLPVLGTGTGGGAAGNDGREVQLRNSGGFIQWKYDTDTVWTNIVALSAITGPAAAMRVSGTSIQWQNVGDASWVDLLPVAGVGVVGWARAVFIPNGGTVPAGTPANTIVIEAGA